jgi:hypothetical protein
MFGLGLIVPFRREKDRLRAVLDIEKFAIEKFAGGSAASRAHDFGLLCSLASKHFLMSGGITWEVSRSKLSRLRVENLRMCHVESQTSNFEPRTPSSPTSTLASTCSRRAKRSATPSQVFLIP